MPKRQPSLHEDTWCARRLVAFCSLADPAPPSLHSQFFVTSILTASSWEAWRGNVHVLPRERMGLRLSFPRPNITECAVWRGGRDGMNDARWIREGDVHLEDPAEGVQQRPPPHLHWGCPTRCREPLTPLFASLSVSFPHESEAEQSIGRGTSKFGIYNGSHEKRKQKRGDEGKDD